MSRLWILLLAPFFIGVAAFQAILPDQPTSGFRIQAAGVLALKDAQSEPLADSRVARDSRGRYFVAPIAQRGRIGIFTDQGLYALIGKPGRGPGEIGEVQTVAVSPRDSIWVLDAGSDVVSIYSPSLKFARSFRRPPDFLPGTPLIEMEGRFIAARFGVSSNLPDYGIVEFTADGVPVKKYGERLDFNRRMYTALTRVGLDLWATVDSPAEIDVFTPEGRLERTYRRAVRGLKPWNGSMRRIPYYTEIAAGSDGVVWAIGRAYNGESNEAAGIDEEVPAAARQPSVNQVLDDFTYYIEAIDARSNRLLARAHMRNRLPRGFLPGDQLYALSETEEGDIQLEIWKLRLRRFEK